jgi:hypothetical protein
LKAKKVLSHWDEKEEQWYFSVIDVVGILTDSPDPKDYWYRMKKREKLLGFELSTICRQLKMELSDGEKYATDEIEKKAIEKVASTPLSDRTPAQYEEAKRTPKKN